MHVNSKSLFDSGTKVYYVMNAAAAAVVVVVVVVRTGVKVRRCVLTKYSNLETRNRIITSLSRNCHRKSCLFNCWSLCFI